MNKNSTNALLKILEEPNKNVYFILIHITSNFIYTNISFSNLEALGAFVVAPQQSSADTLPPRKSARLGDAKPPDRFTPEPEPETLLKMHCKMQILSN